MSSLEKIPNILKNKNENNEEEIKLKQEMKLGPIRSNEEIIKEKKHLLELINEIRGNSKENKEDKEEKTRELKGQIDEMMSN